jgi:type I restriction enzyme, S subunit
MGKLPESWTTTKISEVLEILDNGKLLQQGWSPRCIPHPSLSDDDWGVLKTTAIQAGKFVPEQNKQLPENLTPRPQIEVKAGDILMTCAGPRNRCGVPCFVNNTPKKLMMSGKMYRFRGVAPFMNNKYIMFFLLSHDAQRAIDEIKTGINDSGLNLTHDRFKQLEFSLPPSNLQTRIVAKIEHLFSELDKGVENLKIAKSQLKAYRKSILKNAFEKRGSGDASIEEIFECLKAPYSTHYNKILKKYKQSTDELKESGSFFSIPLSELTEPNRSISYGVIKLGKEDPDGIPTLRSSNVRSLHMDENYIKKISPNISNKYARTILNGGEILITIRGTLGGVCVVPKHFKGYNISREVALISPIKSIDPRYLQYYLASPTAENLFREKLRGVAYTGINLGSLKEIPILVTDTKKQIEIADRLDGVFSLVVQQEKIIEESISKVRALKDVILKKAFAGELVPQDQTDEPASVLLERIKAEKTAQTNSQIKPKTPKRKKAS